MNKITKTNKKDIPYAQKLIPLIISAVVIYAIADILLQVFYGVEISPTLTTCWFSFFGVEIINLAIIKAGKVKVRTPDSFGYLRDEIIESATEELSNIVNDEVNNETETNEF